MEVFTNLLLAILNFVIEVFLIILIGLIFNILFNLKHYIQRVKDIFKNKKQGKKIKVGMTIFLIIAGLIGYRYYYINSDEFFNNLKIIPYEISIDLEEEYNNSVGNDWIHDIQFDYRDIDEEQIYNLQKGQKYKLKITTEEDDTIPDRATAERMIELYNKKHKFLITNTVRENRGRYSGHTAKWNYTINFEYVPDFWNFN